MNNKYGFKREQAMRYFTQNPLRKKTLTRERLLGECGLTQYVTLYERR